MPPANDSVLLPAPLTRFFGRSREKARAVHRLRTRQSRLLTLTGPGGVGKTRLALRIAEEVQEHFAHGVRFVTLASVKEPALALSALAHALDIEGDEGEAPVARLQQHLHHRELLLVLDNLEQIVAIGEDLAQLLNACPRLVILTTSRISLHVASELEIPIAPFPVSSAGLDAADDLRVLTSTDAVALFIDRAAAAVPSFAVTGANARDIVAICHRCDGLPLALELAAARLRILSPGELATRLDDRLLMLAGGSHELPERLQAMRQAIAWSYDLLPAQQKELFRWMSVFVDGCGIDAVEQIASCLSREPGAMAVDLVAGLIDANLVQRIDGANAPTRFLMLETIREYGIERLLAEGDDAVARHAHASWCIAFAEPAGALLSGPDHVTWWRRIEIELGNIRAAHEWLFRQHDAERALRLGTALSWFWTAAGYHREGRALFRQLIAMTDVERLPTLLDGVLSAASNLEHWLDNFDEAKLLNMRRLALCRERGDIPGVVSSLRALSSIAIDRAEHTDAERFLVEGLALATEPVTAWDAAAMLNLQGILAFGQGNYEKAAASSWAAVEGWDALEDIGHVSAARANQARALLMSGDVRRSAETLCRVLEVVQADVGDDMITHDCLSVAGGIALAAQDVNQCVQLLAAADAMLNRIGVSLRPCFRDFGDRLVARSRNRLGEAAFVEWWAAGASLPLADSLAMARTVATASRLAPPMHVDADDRLGALTEREWEVLRLIARGVSDKEIATELGITRFTASNHVSNIRAKLAAPSRSAVVAVAARAGLL